MKPYLPLVAAVIILFSACRSAATFESPNEFRNLSGTLHLTNGRTVEGKLVVNTDNSLGSRVKVFLPGEKKPQHYALQDVEGYDLRGEYYELKEIRGGFSLGANYSFMKQLTPKGSRIHLYENLEKDKSTVTNRDGTTSTRTRYETQYYMQFPAETGDAVWAVNSSKFVPNFDEKMSKLVADCPALASKIANKDAGYFYAQVSLFKEKRADVLWNIISEYNRCR
ncbi:MAG: hypothetical protein K0Q66_1079 [Chitinophagaceae bacterium]|nr:hypothetical protein [Chitinophagaceae bacterium]